MALGSNLKKGETKKADESVQFKSVTDKEESLKEVETEQSPDNNGEVSVQKVKGKKKGKKADKEKENRSKRSMMIVFPVDKEEYALSIDMVNEVVKMPGVAPIPQTPDYILGVANIRGNVIAILDLASRIGVAQSGDKAIGNYVLVIKNEDFQVGLAVDKVPDTVPVYESEIDTTSSVMMQSSQDHSYIKGIIKKEGRMIIMIDVLEMAKMAQVSVGV